MLSLIFSLVSSVCFSSEIRFDSKVLLKNAKTECRFLYRDGAANGVYCPKNTKPEDMISDFKEIHLSQGWVLPIFDVFDNLEKAPSTFKEYTMMPDNIPFQPYTFQFKDGLLIEKICFKKGKRTQCKF